MKNLKGLFIAIAALALVISVQPVNPAFAAPDAEQKAVPLSFGVLDVRAVKAASGIGKDLAKQIDSKMLENHKSVSEDVARMDKKRAELAKAQATMKPDEFQKKASDFGKEMQEKQKNLNKREDALNKAATVALNNLNNQIEAAAAAVAKEHGLVAVFTQDVVVIAEKRSNITEEVIDYLNKHGKKIAVDWSGADKK
jgi:Skp family chaperone for outer membrane proteins